MKTRINKTRAMMALLALATVATMFTIAGAPAMAAPVDLDSAILRDFMPSAANLDKVREMLDPRIPSGMIPGLDEVPLPDDGPFPDGGGWEPVFPEDILDDPLPGDEGEDTGGDTADEGDEGDEAVDETPEAVDEADSDDAAADEDVAEDSDETGAETDTPADTEDVTDDAAEEETPEAGDEDVEQAGDETAASDEPEVSDTTVEAAELPYTGGSSIPWLIAGAAIILAGASLLLRRRGRVEDR